MIRMSRFPSVAGTLAGAALAVLTAGQAAAQDLPDTLTLDWAYYNPVSLVLKDQGLLEEEFADDGIAIQWVQSLGSNKAIEFLNSGSADFGSTAGAAALLARINGAPIEAVYVFSKPEWTALVTGPDSGIDSVEDLAGKRVAVTRGTDPYIFLLRALAEHGLSEQDIEPVLLQHQDGRTALETGQVDAWAGLDPMMAQTELEHGSRLFFRDPDKNSYGVLNVREELAAEHPELVERVLAVYERARLWSVEHPDELRGLLAEAAGLSDEVAARQLERTDLSNPVLGDAPRETIAAAGVALQQSGVIPADVDVQAAVDALIEPRFSAGLGG